MKTLPLLAENSEEPSELLERFMKEFTFKLCITEQEKQQSYRLRYDVYCEELQYEEPTDLCKKLEYDIHDQNSIHCLIEHRRTGIVAGCVRAVIPQLSSLPPLNQLPLQTYGSQSLTHTALHPDQLAKDSYYEISRLAVSPHFRFKAKYGATSYAANDSASFTLEEKQLFPLLVSGLFLTGYAIGRLLGKTQVFAMMEPALPRMLSISGFHFTKVGETIDFHGRRSAYYIDYKKAESGMKEALMPLYTHIKKELKIQLDDMHSNDVRSMSCSAQKLEIRGSETIS